MSACQCHDCTYRSKKQDAEIERLKTELADVKTDELGGWRVVAMELGDEMLVKDAEIERLNTLLLNADATQQRCAKALEEIERLKAFVAASPAKA